MARKQQTAARRILGNEEDEAMFRVQHREDQIEEWREKYVDYGAVADYILSCPPKAVRSVVQLAKIRPSSAGTTEQTPLLDKELKEPQEEASSPQERALEHIQKEIEKAEAFFRHRYHLFTGRWRMVQQFSDLTPAPTTYTDPDQWSDDRVALHEAICENHRGFLILQNYAAVNNTAVHRLYTHYDSKYGTTKGHWWLLQSKVASPVAFIEHDQDLNTLLEETVLAAAKHFHRGNREVAESDLRARRQMPATDSYTIFKLGLFLGICLPLFILMVFFMSVHPYPGYDETEVIRLLPVFRFHLVIALTMWLWGIVVWALDTARINHSFILSLDRRTEAGPPTLFTVASMLTALWLWCFVFFIGKVRCGLDVFKVSPEWFPLSLTVILITVFACPFDVVLRPTRYWILRKVAEVAKAPFIPVTFSANFAGDYMTSMVKGLTDFEYTLCLGFVGEWKRSSIEGEGICRQQSHYAFPIIICLPLVWRFFQCLRRAREDNWRFFPHCLNGCKYLLSITTTLFSAFEPTFASGSNPDWPPMRVFWLFILTAGSLSTFLWDVCIDWGFFAWKDGRFRITVSSLHGESRGWYILPVVFDFLGRAAWTVTLTVQPSREPLVQHATVFVSVMIEITRRSLWSFFRLINEHNNNVGQFRVLKKVPLKFSRNTRLGWDDAMLEEVAEAASTPHVDHAVSSFISLLEDGVEDSKPKERLTGPKNLELSRSGSSRGRFLSPFFGGQDGGQQPCTSAQRAQGNFRRLMAAIPVPPNSPGEERQKGK